MTGQILIIVMSALGIDLSLNPKTNKKLNPRVFKALKWLLPGIISKLSK